MPDITPAKLHQGDEIRIIAPSTGLKIIGADCRQIAKERFASWGLKVSFAKNTTDENFDYFGSSNAALRAADIMEAFTDAKVKAIFSIIGGFNSNQILPFLNYDVIRQNPKIICGFSDITALLNGIRAQTGLKVLYGPHYSSIGMLKGNEYTLEMLKPMLFEEEANWEATPVWSDDLWFLDQQNRQFTDNEGWWYINPGRAEGTLEGGNLGTYVLLNGTPYQPKWQNPTILAVEDCFTAEAADAKYFLRQLQALAQREDFKYVKALLIGRFQKSSNVSKETLTEIVRHIPQLANLPVIGNMDFGHTTPIATLPLGGFCRIEENKVLLRW
jgi:muramoyltetrapeptide carboxypeptidase LdcA involved in peptidoglycan recycling